MKVIFSCGHTPSGTAGCGAVDAIDESVCTREVGVLCTKYMIEQGHQSECLVTNYGNSYNCEDCYTRAKQANNIGADLFTEIHFNSGDGDPSGVEVLINSDSSSAKAYAEKVCDKISKALNIPNRGVKVQRLIVLSRTNMPAMLVECHFVQPHDAALYNADTIARSIVGGILNQEINKGWKQGWNHSDGKWWYCVDPEAKTYYRQEWKLIDGKWYLFDYDGWCMTGWVKYVNKEGKDIWYYLDPRDCSMEIGWKKIDNEWYYFNKDGEMQTGWITVDEKDYCLYSNGSMIHDIDLYGYHFDSDGVATKL